ncbi:hypothetical protein P4H27_30135 [Paenibacillus taichungensis]|uniref:hypothetical protein n=1 Tax=Paenibacillus taichungensis TaxID=484184 RepID=UPI002DBE6587|nr:hypothetical protein [Paenibacillus taichungensis]MEC0111214.1 hypothetical protein [Paenibacillus taichungensis]MEC0200878.1 hypothetical protein [Paenibacillus taichungensis]
MKGKKLVPLILAGIVAASILIVSTTTAERVVAQTPMEAAIEYFDAYIAKDAEGMMFYSKDTNYLDEKSREEGYVKDFKTNPTTGYEIVESKQINSNEVQLYVVQKYAGQSYEQSPPLPFKVFKSETGWKVLVEPLEINTATGEVTKGTPEHARKYMDN